jgi:hypothetical protein
VRHFVERERERERERFGVGGSEGIVAIVNERRFTPNNNIATNTSNVGLPLAVDCLGVLERAAGEGGMCARREQLKRSRWQAASITKTCECVQGKF